MDPHIFLSWFKACLGVPILLKGLGKYRDNWEKTPGKSLRKPWKFLMDSKESHRKIPLFSPADCRGARSSLISHRNDARVRMFAL